MLQMPDDSNRTGSYSPLTIHYSLKQ
jgi:hypothetical protein